jgi:small subunit ribosomal protein S6
VPDATTISKNAAKLSNYEILLALKPVLDVEAADNVLRQVVTAIQNLQGQVLQEEKVGRKKLAYEMNHFRDALMAVLHIQLPPSAMVSLRNTLQLHEDLLRVTILKMDQPELVAITSTSTTGPAYGVREMTREGRPGGGERGEGRPDHRDGAGRDGMGRPMDGSGPRFDRPERRPAPVAAPPAEATVEAPASADRPVVGGGNPHT